MLVKNTPRTVRSSASAEALIREARRRQRRRWALITVLVLALGGVGVIVVVGPGGSPSAHKRALPEPSSVPPPGRQAPLLAGLTYPSKLAVANDGSLLIADRGTFQIKQRLPDGALRVIAGTGAPGRSGDGGPATRAQLGSPADIEVAPDGTIYFTDFVSDVATSRLRAIRLDGTITTVSNVIGAGGLTIASDRSIWTAGSGGIHRVTRDGASELVLPSGPNGLQLPSGDTYLWPRDLAFDGDGNLYVSNHSPPMLIELSPAFEVVGTWEGGRSYGGIVGTDSGVLFDAGGSSVRQIDNGTMTVRLDLTNAPGLPAFRTSGLALGPRGEIYVDQAGQGGWDGGVPLLVEVEPDGHAKLLEVHPA